MLQSRTGYYLAISVPFGDDTVRCESFRRAMSGSTRNICQSVTLACPEFHSFCSLHLRNPKENPHSTRVSRRTHVAVTANRPPGTCLFMWIFSHPWHLSTPDSIKSPHDAQNIYPRILHGLLSIPRSFQRQSLLLICLCPRRRRHGRCCKLLSSFTSRAAFFFRFSIPT